MPHYYDDFYSRGGWQYDRSSQKHFLVERVVEPLKLRGRLRLLDIGCGMGLHSALFAELGFAVTGIDTSAVAIKYARAHYPHVPFLNLNAANLESAFDRQNFDIIVAKGMSWYHYELGGVNKHGVDVPRQTLKLFSFLKEGGTFILAIKTDFSGRRPKHRIHHNKLEDYAGLFGLCGTVVFMSDWKGSILRDNDDGVRSAANVIVATRRLLSPGIVGIH